MTNPLFQTTLFERRDFVAEAVERIRGYADLAGAAGYWLAYSGGKDSVVILELAKMAGVRFEAHHSLTTIDPPELVQFVKETPGVTIDRPPLSFFQLLISRGMPPFRHARWCCRELKEPAGKSRLIITGVRWAESKRRAGRRMFETCYKAKGTRFLHPIIDWTDNQVWAFIRDRGIKYCSLYDCGRKRIGCLLCPFASPSQRFQDCKLYPKYENAFRVAFRQAYATHKHKPAVNRWPNGDAWFEWWIGEPETRKADGGLFYLDN